MGTGDERGRSGVVRIDGRRAGLGRRSEAIVEKYLGGLGWRILATNWRIRLGEMDLIGLDGSTLVFVEVKALHVGNRDGPTAPVHGVGGLKQARLVRLAEAWLAGPGRRLDYSGVRFDVVGVAWQQGLKHPLVDHVEGAFLADRA